MLLRSTRPSPPTLDALLGAELAASLNRVDVLSRKILSGKMPGERRSKKRGQSVEFDDYREYVPGDDLRHVDWNVFARLDRFFIKLFREDEDLALHLIVDRSPSMDAAGADGEGKAGETKLLVAHRLAMALAYIGLVNQNRVRVSLFGPARTGEPPAYWRLAPLRGRRNIQRVGAFLLESLSGEPVSAARVSLPTEADDPSGINAAVRAAAREARGVVVVLSDFMASSGFQRGLNAIGAAPGVDAAWVQILTPSELDPALDAERGLLGDLALIDAETGKRAEVTLSPAAVRAYRRRIREQIDTLAHDCAARGITHLLHTTDTPIERLLLGSLRQRKMIG